MRYIKMKIRWFTTPFKEEHDPTKTYLYGWDIAKSTGGAIAQLDAKGQIELIWYFHLRDINSASYTDIYRFMKNELMMTADSFSVVEGIHQGKTKRGMPNIKPTITLAGTRQKIIMPLEDNFGDIHVLQASKIIPYLISRGKRINPYGYGRVQKKKDTIEVITKMFPKINKLKISIADKEDICDAMVLLFTYIYLKEKRKL